MVLVTGGIYIRGLDSLHLQNDMARFDKHYEFFSQEYPAFRISVSSFYMDKYEVTNAEFKKFTDANPQWSKAKIPANLHDGNYLKDWQGNFFPTGKAHYPVVYVCWRAALAYAGWEKKRLPTEAEWEYSARGYHELYTEFPWGNADANSNKANYAASNIGEATVTGKYAPNNLGIYDLAGNVSELCADMWRQNSYADRRRYEKDRSYRFNENLDPDNTVIRGGSWNYPAVNLRGTWRAKFPINSCSATVGFRCAANAHG